MKKVEHMTRESIASALKEEFGRIDTKPVPAAENGERVEHPKKMYTDKLADADIKNFFAPLGYLNHFPIDKVDGEEVEPFILVECEDVIVMFNDFTTRVYEKKQNTPLANYAELTNSNLGQLIAFQVATELFGRKFPRTYPQKKRDFDLANIDKSFKALSPDLRKFLGSAKDVQESIVKSTFNVNEYGTASYEDVPDNIKMLKS